MGRVVMVNRPDEGGAFEHVAGLSRGLIEAGHEVMICGPLSSRAADLAAEVVPIKMMRSIAPWDDARAIRELRRAFRRLRPDLIHAHGSKGGVMGRLASLAVPRIPLVHTPHGYAFAGHFKSGREQAVYKQIERGLSPLTQREICVCDAEARLAATVGPRRKIRVVHNGIEIPPPVIPDPRVEALRERGPVVTTVSGLRPGKGIETLLDALPALLAAHPATQVAIAGSGVEGPALEARASALGVAAAVTWLGEVSDPYPVLAAADGFAFPSWAESFPYAILEAMAASAPIVASDVGGVGEAIEDGETGLLVPPRDSGALADAMGRLIGDPAAASRLGSAARSRLEQRFTLARMVERTIAVYEGVGFRSPVQAVG
ncbi:MAG TPA: glycosyltransferase family 4 protein [Solirubrobacterales bacterium]